MKSGSWGIPSNSFETSQIRLTPGDGAKDLNENHAPRHRDRHSGPGCSLPLGSTGAASPTFTRASRPRSGSWRSGRRSSRTSSFVCRHASTPGGVAVLARYVRPPGIAVTARVACRGSALHDRFQCELDARHGTNHRKHPQPVALRRRFGVMREPAGRRQGSSRPLRGPSQQGVDNATVMPHRRFRTRGSLPGMASAQPLTDWTPPSGEVIRPPIVSLPLTRK
jgi:hypothetical protein